MVHAAEMPGFGYDLLNTLFVPAEFYIFTISVTYDLSLVKHAVAGLVTPTGQPLLFELCILTRRCPSWRVIWRTTMAAVTNEPCLFLYITPLEGKCNVLLVDYFINYDYWGIQMAALG